MSVLLPNMELPPKDCSYCSEICGDGAWAAVEENCYHGKAIEIKTPHGRLIDADALCRIDGKDEEGFSCQIVYDWDIEKAPTIIEAEGGQDNE